MKRRKGRKILLYSALSVVSILGAFVVWQMTKTVPTNGDWQDVSRVQSTATFDGNFVTVHNIRNFQYDANRTPTVEAYYDKTYDLRTLKKVWYITDPFSPGSPFAHTFISFEFADESFLAITIEGRLTKGQEYNLLNGTIHTFPLIYIAADERDVIYVRTNIHHDGVYVYPMRATPEQGRLLLTDILHRMNELVARPDWYNSIYANCTSSIANHINRIWPGVLPTFDWQELLTSYADELALQKGLVDTTLPLDQARQTFYVTDRAQHVGYVADFSTLIRQTDTHTQTQ